MPYVLVLLLVIGGLVGFKPVDNGPNVLFGFLADGQVIDMKRGTSVDLDVLEARFKLTADSEAKFPALKGQPIRGTAEVSFARTTQRFSMISWNWNEPLSVGAGNAQPGDRIIIAIKHVEIRQKDGNWLKMRGEALPVYMFGLY